MEAYTIGDYVPNLSLNTLLPRAWKAYKDRFWRVFLMNLAPLSFIFVFLVGGLLVLVSEVPGGLNLFQDRRVLYGLLAASFAASLVMHALAVGVVYAFVRIIRGETPPFRTIFTVFRSSRAFAVLLAVVVGWGVGALLLLVPGIIFVARFAPALVLIADQNIGVGEALRCSWRITRGFTLPLVLAGIVAALVILAGYVAFQVGLLFTVPFASLLLAAAADELTRRIVRSDVPAPIAP